MRLAREGRSNREIAAATGLSRGKVAGLIHRAGIVVPDRVARRWLGVVAPPPAPPVVRVLAPGTCRFPLWGDERPAIHVYCGKKVIAAGKPYCAAHHALTHRVVGPLDHL